MSNDKLEATGYPLPQRHPMEALARWGEPPPDDPVPHVTDPAAYRSPGSPPWEPPPGPPSVVDRVPAWAWVVGSSTLAAVLYVLTALTFGPAPSGVTPSVEPVVTVTGTCEKKIIGGYGLVASVVASNPTRDVKRGEVWVRWLATGHEPRVFSRALVLEPGGKGDHYVNERVNADEWFRIEDCDYGWSPAP